MKKRIATFILMLFIAFSGLTSKPKQEKVKLDPEFDKYLKEFSLILTQKKFDQMPTVINFPLQSLIVTGGADQCVFDLIKFKNKYKQVSEEWNFSYKSLTKGEISLIKFKDASYNQYFNCNETDDLYEIVIIKGRNPNILYFKKDKSTFKLVFMTLEYFECDN
jgi:hypothetical protein